MALPGPIQNGIDAIDAQIQKERSAVVNVLLGTPVYVLVSLPLAYIAGVMAIAATGTVSSSTVASADTTIGLVVGVAVVIIFWAFSAYGTYSYSRSD
jgi:F0F1-type ATP synthase membrane subunit a